jgi:hypothetical protein
MEHTIKANVIVHVDWILVGAFGMFKMEENRLL